MQRESKYIEYKSEVSKTYLKTVSAFANYNGGEIVFGISDAHKILGLENPNEDCLNIENQINDSIRPRPEFSLRINGDKTITLSVKKGDNTPYRYNGKAYKRSDSSTVEVDDLEEKRLILEGENLSFEELKSRQSNLGFSCFQEKLTSALSLERFDLDTLKSLSLYNEKNGYNNAAELLSDNNGFPGLDIAVFLDSINIFKKRVTLSKESILKQYDDALELYKSEYEVEKIEGGFRTKYELIPFEAFREALANALVHRAYDVNACTKIEMHPDKIIVSSPGGLMSGMSKDDYISGRYSCLRNPLVANVFRRLNIIEAFATGIKRINESYKEASSKPIYEISESSISVTLPLLDKINIAPDERRVLEAMKLDYSYSRNELENGTGFSKDKIIRILNSLLEKGIVKKEGKGKGTFYSKR